VNLRPSQSAIWGKKLRTLMKNNLNVKAGGIWPKLCKALGCQSSLFFLYCSSMSNFKKKKKMFSFKSPFFHHMVKIYLKDRLVSRESS